MKRSALIFNGLLVLFSYVLFSCKSGNNTNQEAAVPTTQPEPAIPVSYNDLPNMQLTRPNGSQFVVNTLPGKTILVFFQPDCDHCQRETEEIRKNLPAFQDYTLYFISEAPMPEITKFAQKYNIVNQPNIQFAQTTISELMKTLGSFSLPSVYVYGEDRRLKKAFNGETAIGAILATL